MKGNKMSAILAILLMLCGTLAVFPLVHGSPGPTCSEIAANVPIPFQGTQVQSVFPFPPVSNIHFQYSTNGTQGTKFWVDIDAYNVSEMTLYQVGFYFNPNLLQVLKVVNGSVLNQLQGNFITVGPSINNPGGVVKAGSWAATSGFSMNGTGPEGVADLMNVEFNVTGTPAYQISIAGVPQNMTWFSPTITQIQIIVEGVGSVVEHPTLVSGTVTYTLPPPAAPVAYSTVNGFAPPTVPTVTTGTAVTFDAVGSTAGWTGVATAPIVTYYWDLLWNSTVVTTTSPTITVTFATPGSYTLDLTVNAQLLPYNMNSTNLDAQSVIVVTPPTGCLITLYTQNWRYIDPNMWSTSFVGDQSGLVNGTEADSFRPGDLVQLFANATYNGAPVSNALVTFEVFNNLGQTVLTATAVSNCYGVAEWDFRIPWPSDVTEQVNNFTQGSFALQENTTFFGEWKAYATWQLGSQFTEQPPFEKTQAAYITFDVSWGLSVTISGITPNPAMRGPNSCGYGSDVVVKVNVMNEYLEPVSGLLTCTLYDNLLVPIYPTGQIKDPFPVGTSSYSFASISIPSYAFVGNGYAVVNLLSTWPSNAGTAFCPTAWETLVINPYS